MHSQAIHPEALTLAVLAGGQGSRMGQAKAELLLHGQPILAHLLRRLQWPGPTMLVTAPGRTAPVGRGLFDREVVDPVAGQGPLRGILSALQQVGGDLLVLTVDMPGVTRAMLQRLIDMQTVNSAVGGIMFQRVADDPKSVEPFPCLIGQGARDVVAAALQTGRRSVRGLLGTGVFTTIATGDDWPATVWTNLNTPEDLAAYEQLCRRGSDGL